MGRIDILCQAEVHVGVNNIDQVMRHLPPLLVRRFGGADVHLAIDGHRIERNDFRTNLLGQFQTDGRLSGSRGTSQKPAIGGGLDLLLHFVHRSRTEINSRLSHPGEPITIAISRPYETAPQTQSPP